MSLKNNLRIGQASSEYFIIFAVIAGLTLLSAATFLPQVRDAAEGLFNKAAGRISGNAEGTTPPTSVNGISLPWNENHIVEDFEKKETKTFILRASQNDSNQNPTAFEVEFQQMGFGVEGSIKLPLKSDGTHYKLKPEVLARNNTPNYSGDPDYSTFQIIEDESGTLITGLWAANEGAIVFYSGDALAEPLQTGDFIFTLTAGLPGWGDKGWGWIATSIYYPPE
jgi:hypothetical protein